MAEIQREDVDRVENREDSEFSGELVRELSELVRAHPCNYARMIKTEKYAAMLSWIMRKTDFATAKWLSLKSRIYMAINDFAETPKCRVCGNAVTKNVMDVNRGFSAYCCRKCASADPAVAEKRKKTSIERYGVPCASSSPEAKAKRRNSVMRRYGVDNVAKSNETKEKIRRTCAERYGVDNYAKTAECAEKTKRTCREKYGVDYAFQSDETKETSRRTCREKYGVDNAGGIPETLEKIRRTNFERRGVEYPQQDPEVRAKSAETCVERYGVAAPFARPFVLKNNAERVKRASFERFIANDEYDEPAFTVEEYVGRSSNADELPFRCRKCGKTFVARHKDGRHSRCPSCFPPVEHGVSKEEKDLLEFVKSKCDFEVISGARDVIPPYELDVYVPEKKLAFEFDGLYWHSDARKDKNYHLAKTDACRKLGVKLIHVFETEWTRKNDVVKSRVAATLGRPDRTLFARKCEVAEISGRVSFEFQEKNHTQGGTRSKINFGLFSADELVGVMTFSKPRFSRRHDWELVRFCTKNGTRVVGGASKLLKAFERAFRPKSIVSYADRRWSDGNLYSKLGFRHVADTAPAPWYFKPGDFELKSRFRFQKHKLADVLDSFDPAETETENMFRNGYCAIYDCGCMTFEKEY